MTLYCLFSLVFLAALCQIPSPTDAFLPSCSTARVAARRHPNQQIGIVSTQATVFGLEAKKSKRRVSKGFGKIDEDQVAESPRESTTEPATTSALLSDRAAPPATATSSSLLQSVPGGSTGIPQEDELPAEERAARILREKYGMKTLEEQQLTAKQQEALQERKKKLQEWKKAVESNEDFDIMSAVPAPVLKAVDLFLKGGVVVSGTLFILAGIGITIEAWGKTSGQPIDSNLDRLVVETIEPNFTTSLFVLLAFSISLGLFAAAQLGSAGAQYREDK